MHRLYYQPEGFWFGDCMPFGKDNKFYLFHQRDTRKPGPFGEPFGWDLAVTSDFVHYEDLGVAIPRGMDDEQDQFIFAGSIFAADSKYHAFYTGYNRGYPALGKASQVLMHAISDDLVHWQKSQMELTFNPQPGYDLDDWRDPFVLWDEENQDYLLILGARKLNGKKQINGCTVQFRSKDLHNWQFHGDFWSPSIYTMHEMPDLFKIGDWWYLIISEYSDKNKIVYRMSKSLNGPWMAPVDDAFDGRAYYAGRTFELNNQRILFGWVPTKEDDDDQKNFQWGGTFVAHEIFQREDGTLGVKMPDAVWQAFEDRQEIEPFSLSTIDSRAESTLVKESGTLFSWEADISWDTAPRSFAVKLFNNDETDEGYQFIFFPGENRYVFEKSPNQPWFQCMNIGLDRPFSMSDKQTCHIRLIVDDTIATIYVDGVALNTRMYKKPGETLSVFVTDGQIRVSNSTFSNSLSAE